MGMLQFNPLNDPRKRNYLLPPGCKDLVDALNQSTKLVLGLKQMGSAATKAGFWKYTKQTPGQAPGWPQTPASQAGAETFPAGEVEIPERAPIKLLARILGKKIYQIIADLMELNVFANVNESVDFETASKVLRKYGYQVKKPGASPPPASL
jgi:hypothetical protein